MSILGCGYFAHLYCLYYAGPLSCILGCNVKHSGVPLSALDSTQINNLIWLSRTLVNVMEEYFAKEIVQSCGKECETEVTKMDHFFLQ